MMVSIKSYRSPKVEVRTNSIAGRGLFAKDFICKDEIIAIRSGHIVEVEESLKLDKSIGDFSLQIHDNFCLCPRSVDEVDDIVIFLNHSCDPNIGMNGETIYVAMRNIQPDEELYYDYSMAMTHLYYLDCNCGAKNCRGVITGQDWTNQELQQRYGSYFSSFILKKIKSISE